ncbi:MAG: hypothetical protein HN348_19695, partial [Proteobacteria bacterium]|nr:hypothetical protein [Pseudomonadota bacterium]
MGPRPVGVHTLGTEPLPIEDLSPAPMLCFAPALSEGSTQLTKGDEVLAGHTLWSFGDEKTQPCPVSGKVHSIGLAPNIRGGKSQTSVLIEPTSQVRILPPLNDGATTTEILQRFREAGVHTNEALPRPLADALAVESLGALIIVAIDREPQVFASIQLFLERRQDLAAAAKLLRQVTGTQEIHLAVPAPLASTVSDVPVLAIPP